MKRLLSIITVFTAVFVLSSCSDVEPVIVEVPVIEEVEVDTVSTTFYHMEETGVVIFVISKGEESYVFEFEYIESYATRGELGGIPIFEEPPMMDLIRVQHHNNGVIEEVLSSNIPIYEPAPVMGYDDFIVQVDDFTSRLTWDNVYAVYGYMFESANRPPSQQEEEVVYEQ